MRRICDSCWFSNTSSAKELMFDLRDPFTISMCMCWRSCRLSCFIMIYPSGALINNNHPHPQLPQKKFPTLMPKCHILGHWHHHGSHWQHDHGLMWIMSSILGPIQPPQVVDGKNPCKSMANFQSLPVDQHSASLVLVYRGERQLSPGGFTGLIHDWHATDWPCSSCLECQIAIAIVF